MNTERIKLCALCDNKIPHNHVVCPTHYKEYALYKNEQWFIELVEMQRKQYEIDKKEIVTIHKLSENTLTTYLARVLRSHGRRSLPKDIIIDMYLQGKRAFEIANELKINKTVIRVIISRYKRNKNTK